MSSKRVAQMFDESNSLSPEQKDKTDKADAKFNTLATELVRMLPESPELTVGLRHLLNAKESVRRAIRTADA